MSRSLLEDAFAHHVWATLRLIDACLALNAEQLGTAVPGTYGSILETMRHIVGDDSWSLFVASGERIPYVDRDQMSLPELRSAMQRNGDGWSRLLGEDIDPDAVLREVDPHDGYERRTPMGILLTHPLQHGSDHRSQICTALTALGVEPPKTDAFQFGLQDGRVTEILPGS